MWKTDLLESIKQVGLVARCIQRLDHGFIAPHPLQRWSVST